MTLKIARESMSTKLVTVNLNENIERLNLSVDRILPLPGPHLTLAELLRARGKTP